MRFTVGGLRHALERNGVAVASIRPLVGTPGAALNLRQHLLSSWLTSRGFGVAAAAANAAVNMRILLEDRVCPEYAASLAPIALATIARARP